MFTPRPNPNHLEELGYGTPWPIIFVVAVVAFLLIEYIVNKNKKN